MSLSTCSNCGNLKQYKHIAPIDDRLQQTWEISDKIKDLFNTREGSICEHCGVNIRAQGLAAAILNSKYGFQATNLVEWVERANKNKLRVCELNSCHELHHTLKNLNQYTFAEYGTESQQDIENLTYKDNAFDLLLHSETLEHVNDPRKAVDECRRVVGENGLVLFTTPVIWNRKTRRRAERDNGRRIDLLPPSYHGQETDDYLVYYEYGYDIAKMLGIGLALNEWQMHNYVFYTNKRPTNINLITQAKLRTEELISLLGK